jgi:hypothetical protein
VEYGEMRCQCQSLLFPDSKRSIFRYVGRRQDLYGRGLPLGETIVGEAAQRTKGLSAAFIRELMRRIAQASIARDGGASVETGDISEALDDMLFAGGKLNVKLLGGAQEMASG